MKKINPIGSSVGERHYFAIKTNARGVEAAHKWANRKAVLLATEAKTRQSHAKKSSGSSGCFTIVLKRSAEFGFGFKVCGPKRGDLTKHGVFISSIIPAGPAGLHVAHIKTGCQIVKINRKDTYYSCVEEVSDALEFCRSHVELTIRPAQLMYRSQFQRQFDVSAFPARIVRLKRTHAWENWGFEVVGGNKRDHPVIFGVFVGFLHAGGPAMDAVNNGQFRIGDQILFIDEFNVIHADIEDVARLLKNDQGRLLLELRALYRSIRMNASVFSDEEAHLVQVELREKLKVDFDIIGRTKRSKEPQRQGIYISRIDSTSQSYKEGLRAGDRLLGVCGGEGWKDLAHVTMEDGDAMLARALSTCSSRTDKHGHE
eukprot:UC4_evm1s741